MNRLEHREFPWKTLMAFRSYRNAQQSGVVIESTGVSRRNVRSSILPSLLERGPFDMAEKQFFTLQRDKEQAAQPQAAGQMFSRAG